MNLLFILALAFTTFITPTTDAKKDEAVVAALDAEYQLAVLNNDFKTMDRILADDFVLVLGNGKVYTKDDLIKTARDKSLAFERQEDTNRTVRVWGDTAVVTALLWEKFVVDGKTIEKKLWFSDVYIRTAKGWKYVFGQASLALSPA